MNTEPTEVRDDGVGDSMTTRQLPALLSVTLAVLFFAPGPAVGQCSLEQNPVEVLGYGSAVRIAVDPAVQAPVVIWQDPAKGIVYRRFYGPDWGPVVEVHSEGKLVPPGADDTMTQGLDLVLDNYGRPRVVMMDDSGVYHTRYGDGWSPTEMILPVDLQEIKFASVTIRFERDASDRGHVLFWAEKWAGGGRRSYHVFDGGAGFGPPELFDKGNWRPRGATDSQGNLHTVSFGAFADPDNPSGLHQYQAYYWLWTQDGGWPGQHEIITDEPNPPTGNGAGPLGSWPVVAVDASDTPHVVYPMHATEEAQNGEIHYITRTGGAWSEPVNLFPTNGHGGKPCLAVDHRGAMLALSLVYDKFWAVDFGSGFGPKKKWHQSGGHWQFHDLVETRGLFWHVYVPVDWKQKSPGDICVETFVKTGICPGVPEDDPDDDGFATGADLCPAFPDPAQGDVDGDGQGDACDEDDDDDGVDDSADNCVGVKNPAQADSDGDGLGDACSVQVDGDGDGFLATHDCDDNDADAFPGNVEVCDGKDNDCDGETDMPACRQPDIVEPDMDVTTHPDGVSKTDHEPAADDQAAGSPDEEAGPVRGADGGARTDSHLQVDIPTVTYTETIGGCRYAPAARDGGPAGILSALLALSLLLRRSRRRFLMIDN